jgi:hypothetical protein
MNSPLVVKHDRFCFRIHSNGWFIVIDEKTLNDASRVRSSSNRAYRTVKKMLGFSHSDCYRFLTGYKLYVTGQGASKEASYFCSFLD